MPHNIGDDHRTRKPTISVLDVDACLVKPLSGYNNIERFEDVFKFSKGSIKAMFSNAYAFSNMFTNILYSFIVCGNPVTILMEVIFVNNFVDPARFQMNSVKWSNCCSSQLFNAPPVPKG